MGEEGGREMAEMDLGHMPGTTRSSAGEKKGGRERLPIFHTLRGTYQAVVTGDCCGWETVVPGPWVAVGSRNRTGLR